MHYKTLLVIFLLAEINCRRIDLQSGCTLSINSDIPSKPQPLYLNPDRISDDDPYYLPEDNKGAINFKSGQAIYFACPKTKVVVNSTETEFDLVVGTCVSGTKFKVYEDVVPFALVSCKVHPWHTARYTGKNCGDGYSEIEIGFQVQVHNRFLTHLLICFDDLTLNTLYSRAVITKTIGGFQHGMPRTNFIQGNFYRSRMACFPRNLYFAKKLRTTINSLLGLNATDTKYVANNGSLFISRGHLAAKADFVYGPVQRLTFWLVNAAPQWQSVNGGNWNALEQNVRSYASNRCVDLIVYTGTFGVATLPHNSTKEHVGLYLYIDENGNRALPVPAIFWKLVYEPISKAGIVFIAMNNPYIENKELLCPDVSDRLNWLTWNKDNREKGYAYACTVDNFRNIEHNFPDLEVSSLLI